MRTTLATFAAALLCLSASTALAYPSYVADTTGMCRSRTAYTGSSYECADCHVHPDGAGSCNAGSVHPRRPCLNPFGRVYCSTGWAGSTPGGNTDWDGATRTNSYELSHSGSAGFPRGAETVSCDMLAAASSPGNWIRCGVTNIEVRATYSTSGSAGYYFSFQCIPHTGPAPTTTDLYWPNNCLDINECAGNPCSPGSCSQHPLGSWTNPGYTCSCPTGYTASAGGCVVTNACSAGTDTCVSNATCASTGGSGYTCSCPPGYSGDGRSPGTGCTPVNECAPHPCAPFGTGGTDGQGCTQTPLSPWTSPGYTCSCQPGYDFNGTTCAVSDECTAGTNDCNRNATCADPSPRIGDYTCTCNAGYSGRGHGRFGCRDIDECRAGTAGCDRNATCRNSIGSFTCTCNTGYVGSGFTCTDYDECGDPIYSSRCDPNSTCNNLVGTFECNCNTGYRGDGLATCTDIDECRDGADDCHTNAACTNEPGTWSCACNDGYAGDGRSCVDIDECLDAAVSDRCSTVATCENLPGSWHCVCGDGFEGDGFDCADVDECALGTHTCHRNAACSNTPGSFSCTCVDGYEGSGFDCTDIDECVSGTGGCVLNEVCVNQEGMPNTCVCRLGYIRNDAGDCVIACGDGAVAPGEACDDGNTDDGDGCSSRCSIEGGWACFEPTGEASVCTFTCGDGFVDPSEECDDAEANADSPDACRTTCVAPSCGDEIIDSDEGCDDGMNNSDEAADACRTTCVMAYCGDGVMDTGELCDVGGLMPGEAAAGACTTGCASESDAGLMGDAGTEPPMDGGCGCRAASPSGSPWALGLMGLLLWFRRRR